MSKHTAATLKIEINAATRGLMLAFELGEESWLLGFSAGFGGKVLRRKIAARDTVALMRELGRAKQHFDP